MKNTALMIVMIAGTYSYRWALKGQIKYLVYLMKWS
jgi:hypothetical protein